MAYPLAFKERLTEHALNTQSSETCLHSKSLNGNMRLIKKTYQKVGPGLTIFTLQEPLFTTEVLSKAFLLYSRTKTSLVEFILIAVFFHSNAFFLSEASFSASYVFLYLLTSILRRRPLWMKEGGPSSMRRSLIASFRTRSIHWKRSSKTPKASIWERWRIRRLRRSVSLFPHKRKKSTLSSSGKKWRSSHGLTKTCRVSIHL